MLKQIKNTIKNFLLKIESKLEQANKKMGDLEKQTAKMADEAEIKVVENKIKLFQQAKHVRTTDENINELIQIVAAYDNLSSKNKVIEQEIVNISRELNINTL